MPELPDITVYLDALRRRILGAKLESVKLTSPFLLRSIDPPLSAALGQPVKALARVGKRIAIGVEPDVWLVLHLMIAGRLHWNSKKPAQATFTFSTGALTLTEAGTQHRASLHLTRRLEDFNPGGLEVLDATLAQFSAALTQENHTLKRTLTDPRILSGIGNAYSDEILWLAQLSPIAQTQKLSPAEIERLYHATRQCLTEWIGRLRAETGDGFPAKVTAFRPEMAMHGKYRSPCPRCGEPVQRIRYAANETNYCVRCQTGGKLLADRGLSRLLGKDWPRTLEELEALKRPPGAGQKNH
ncbi:MAG: formamidopyrimidine-DNA glycosylase [Bryobacteraceae bacterium]|nr:formamidopyrimidine-DNA glycosylase [Bryobacteraceae bacterium]